MSKFSVRGAKLISTADAGKYLAQLKGKGFQESFTPKKIKEYIKRLKEAAQNTDA